MNLRIPLLFTFSDSDVVNMISVDIVFLQKALRFAHLPWAFPLQLLLSVSFLYSILGMSILQGERKKAISNIDQCHKQVSGRGRSSRTSNSSGASHTVTYRIQL